MIILEGPDGGGKSSLAARISTRFGLPHAPRASHSIDGPVPDLERWVTDDLATWGPHAPTRLYDRYPLISEPIYGDICRPDEPVKLTPEFIKSVRDQFLDEALVIFCLPPLRKVKDVVDRVPQMAGVRNNIPLIWRAYANLVHSYIGKSLMYDYTRTDHERLRQETQLASSLVDHIRARI